MILVFNYLNLDDGNLIEDVKDEGISRVINGPTITDGSINWSFAKFKKLNHGIAQKWCKWVIVIIGGEAFTGLFISISFIKIRLKEFLLYIIRYCPYNGWERAKKN